MPRRPRYLTVLPNQPHHLILRGNNRRRIFSYVSEYRFFLRRLRLAGREYRVRTHALSLMTNHVHLIVTPPDSASLSRFVKSTAQPYAQRRNRARGGTGKLFEERFKCVPIIREEQMAITTVYVELNPVRAGICRDASEYRWSTYAMHAGHGAADNFVRDVWTPSPWFRSLARDAPGQSLAYLDWFEHYRRRDDWKEIATAAAPSADCKRLERPDRRRAR